jgi:nucleoside-diphosphate-sugar epimerase
MRAGPGRRQITNIIDSEVTALGWSPRIELEAGIRSTYEWLLNNRGVVKT